MVVKGWDKDYDYMFVKDTGEENKQQLYIQLSANENIAIKKPYRKREKVRTKDLFGFVNKPCILNYKNKKNDDVVEQFADFKKRWCVFCKLC